MKLKNISGEVVMVPGFAPIDVDATIDVDSEVFQILSRCPALKAPKEEKTFLEDTGEAKKFVSKKSK